uniref:Uncharacterized protein n=1 Tax=Cannabis sativa TaxID=3483 RepID=A0A803P8M0_CANSA
MNGDVESTWNITLSKAWSKVDASACEPKHSSIVRRAYQHLANPNFACDVEYRSGHASEHHALPIFRSGLSGLHVTILVMPLTRGPRVSVAVRDFDVVFEASRFWIINALTINIKSDFLHTVRRALDYF